MNAARGPAPLLAWSIAIAVSAAAQATYALLGPRLLLSPVARFALGYGILIACVLAVARAAPEIGRRALPLAALPLALPVAVFVARPPPDSFGAAATVLVGLLAAGSSVGVFLGGELERAGHLLPVALASSLADVASVLAPSGPTARIVAERPDVLAVVALPFSFGDGLFVPVLGVADVAMTALYMAACRRHGLSAARATLALAAAYGALLVSLFVAARPLPALPLLGAAIVLAFPEARRVPEQERVRVLAVMAVLVALTLALLFA